MMRMSMRMSSDRSLDTSHGSGSLQLVIEDRLNSESKQDDKPLLTSQQSRLTTSEYHATLSAPSTPLPDPKRNEPLHPSSLAPSLRASSLYYRNCAAPDENVSINPLSPQSPEQDDQTAIVTDLFGWTVGRCLGEFHATYYRIPGQFFVATRALLFYSNWLGFERRFCLTFSDIETIQSCRSTSIKISMVDCEEYVFKKFQDRDAVVQVLQELLMRYQLEVEKGQDLLDPPSISRAFYQSTVGSTTHESSLSAIHPLHVIPAESAMPQNFQHEDKTNSVTLRRPHLSSDNTLELDFGGEQPNRRRSLSVPTVIGLDTSEKMTPITSMTIRSTPRNHIMPNPLTGRLEKNERSSSMGNKDHRSVAGRTFSRELRNSGTSSCPNHIAQGHADKSRDHALSDGACREVFAHPIAPPPQSLTISAQEQSHYSKLFHIWLKENKAHEQIALEPTEVDVSPIEFFDLFFHDLAPYSLSRYQQEQIGDKDVRFSLWTVSNNPAAHVHFLEREIDYIHPLNNSIGPSEAKTSRIQKLWQYGDYAIIIQNTTDVEGIPMADCFQVHDQWIVQATGNNAVTLSVSFQVEFVKRTMFKSLIQNNVKTETKKWFQGYVQMLQGAVREHKEAGVASTHSATLAPSVLQEATESSTIPATSEQKRDKERDMEIVEEDTVGGGGRSFAFAAVTNLLRSIRLFDVGLLSNLALFGFLFVLVLQIWSMQTTLRTMEKHLLVLETQNNLFLQKLVCLAGNANGES